MIRSTLKVAVVNIYIIFSCFFFCFWSFHMASFYLILLSYQFQDCVWHVNLCNTSQFVLKIIEKLPYPSTSIALFKTSVIGYFARGNVSKLKSQGDSQQVEEEQGDKQMNERAMIRSIGKVLVIVYIILVKQFPMC